MNTSGVGRWFLLGGALIKKWCTKIKGGGGLALPLPTPLNTTYLKTVAWLSCPHQRNLTESLGAGGLTLCLHSTPLSTNTTRWPLNLPATSGGSDVCTLTSSLEWVPNQQQTTKWGMKPCHQYLYPSSPFAPWSFGATPPLALLLIIRTPPREREGRVRQKLLPLRNPSFGFSRLQKWIKLRPQILYNRGEAASAWLLVVLEWFLNPGPLLLGWHASICVWLGPR